MNTVAYSLVNANTPLGQSVRISFGVANGVSGVAVETNAPGCAAPTTELSYQLVNVTVSTPHGTLILPFPKFDALVTWPTPCVDLGESIVIRLDSSCCESVTFFPGPSAPLPPSPGDPRPTFTIDCDVALAGINRNCAYPPGTAFDADVVLVAGDSPLSVSAFSFDVTANAAGFEPVSGASSGLDENPDFNQSGVTGSFSCYLTIPDTEALLPNRHQSEISCDTPNLDGPVLAPHEALVLARIHYVTGALGSYVIGADNVFIFDNDSTSVTIPIFYLPAVGVVASPASAPTPSGPLTPFPTATGSPAATATPPTFVRSLSVDCDTAAPGIQSSCTLPPGATSTSVDVILTNDGPAFDMQAIGFTVENLDLSRLLAPTIPGCGTFACNPDLNDAAFPGIGWQCGTGLPSPDSQPGTPGQQSTVECFNIYDTTSLIAAGASVKIATIAYDVPVAAAAGTVPLTMKDASVYDTGFGEVMSCRPTINFAGSCEDASITISDAATFTPTVIPTLTATPSTPSATVTPAPPQPLATAVASQNLNPTPAGRYFAIDCDLATAGIQDDCTYTTDAGVVDVGVVFVNEGGAPATSCCFNFHVVSPDLTRLDPPAIADVAPFLNSNPDVNDALFPGIDCSFPPPDNDNGFGGPGTATSYLGCFEVVNPGPVIPAGGSILLGTVRYNVPGTALAGTVPLNLDFSAFYGDDIQEVGSCDPLIIEPATCVNASITFIGPGPRIEKVPEGNANNTDLTIPAANLWICAAPAACAGPGEGALRVVERASNVVEGLGAYEFTVEYDNFVIQSVNPCDLVFGPGGAGSARGPVDELNTSAVNPDCAPDPGGANNGTCAMSLVLENLVHFGCATNGLAAGPTGDFDLASLLLIPHPDLNNDLFPGNNNGVLTVLKDNGCELVDTLGHPVSGSINGGLTPYCRDLAVTVRILEGDLDLDCDVDLTDAQAIAARYGAFFGGLLYSKWYDLEPQFHDLDIDIKDVQKVFGRQGSSCQTPIPAQPPLGPPTAFQD